MRSVICDDEDFAHLVGEGGLYDYEPGERYIVTSAPSSDHGELQNEAQVALRRFFGRVSGPINLGVFGEPGKRWYVVPDAVVLPLDAPRRQDAQLRAARSLASRSIPRRFRQFGTRCRDGEDTADWLRRVGGPPSAQKGR